LVVTVLFAYQTFRPSYFRDVVVPADPRVWGWLHRTLHLPERALLLIYRGFLFYGIGRLISWFLYARFGAKTPFQPIWGGPSYLPAGNDLSDAGPLEVVVRTSIGAVLFVGFLWLCWQVFGPRLWSRGYDPPMTTRGTGVHAVFH